MKMTKTTTQTNIKMENAVWDRAVHCCTFSVQQMGSNTIRHAFSQMLKKQMQYNGCWFANGIDWWIINSLTL